MNALPFRQGIGGGRIRVLEEIGRRLVEIRQWGRGLLFFQEPIRYSVWQFGDFHHSKTCGYEVQRLGCGSTEVYDELLGEGAAVCHLDDDLLAVLWIPDLQHRTEGKFQVGTGHAVSMIFFPIAHLATVEPVGIVGSIAPE